MPGEYNAKLSPEEILEIIKRCSFDGLFVEDSDGTTIFLSDAYEDITGVKPDLLIGKKTEALKRLGILESSVAEQVHKSHQATSMMITYSVSKKNALVTAVPALGTDGSYLGMMGNIRDLSDLNKLQAELERAHKKLRVAEAEVERLRTETNLDRTFIAKSPVMRSLVMQAHRIAQVDATVLITGESGVGKDVFAKQIRNLSKDGTSKPFVKISCGAIPDSLLESELFGYMEGAFTGAQKGGKPGAFELAGDGFIFLDEIGEMPLQLQVKILNVLQDRQFLPVGGTKPVNMNARIIAATNKNLLDAIRAGTFRQDLYYRLNVIPVEIPPLRERRADIVPIVAMMVQSMNEKYGDEKKLSPETLRYLEAYDWPGNVRELVNAVERMMALCPTDEITKDYLPEAILSGGLSGGISLDRANVDLRTYLEQMERHRILLALNKPQSFADAAKELGIDQSTLTRKIQKYKLPKRNQAKHVHDNLSNIRI